MFRADDRYCSTPCPMKHKLSNLILHYLYERVNRSHTVTSLLIQRFNQRFDFELY